MIRLLGSLAACWLLLFAAPAQASFPATLDPAVCSVAPCQTYRAYQVPPEPNPGGFNTKDAAVNAYVSWANGAYPTFRHERNGPVNNATNQAPIKVTRILGSPLGQVSDGTVNIEATAAPPSAPVYTCPANSTLSGTTCTCAVTHNQVGSTCVAKAVCDWAKDMQVAGGSFMIEAGKNFCHSGCTFTLAPDAGSSPFRAKQDGKWYEQRYQGDFKGTGTGATNCGVGDAEEEPSIDPPEDKPEAPAQPCPPGQTAGAQIIAPGGSGGYVCMTPEETQAKQKKTAETTNPDGSTSTTTTEETTICGQDSCNTTTNTTVSSGGTTQTTTQTSSTSKDAFCKSNPSDKNCTGSAGGMSPGSPGAQGAPAVPGLYEQKFPDGIAGVWTAKKNALLATPLGQLTTSLMPNIPAGGSLPVWNLNLDLGGSWDFGTYDVAPSAQVWEWAGVFVVIGALLLARALIFGG